MRLMMNLTGDKEPQIGNSHKSVIENGACLSIA
jgi:hypothetical protein